MVAVQNLKGEIIQLILSRKEGGHVPLLSKIPKFEHHSIASGGYHSVRSLTVLVGTCKDMPHYEPKVFYVMHYIHKPLIHHVSIGGISV
jgi:hypothetical protein